MYKRINRLMVVLGLMQALAANATAPDENQASHELGREIYNYRCYFCHGYSGDAKTLASTYLQPPPRDFTRTRPDTLSRDQMLSTVAAGKPGTAMHGFSRLLNADEIAAVVDFVRAEFITHRRVNSRYHVPENGWPNHQRYSPAFAFATGQIPLDRDWAQLTPEQSRGKRLFLTTCITCHDRARVREEGVIWSKQSVSYPRNNYSHTEIDAISSASVYALHDIPPAVKNLSAEAANGKKLWQQNCAFCHAADGTGENWIGSFLEPKPRNLTKAEFMRDMTDELLLERIREGIRNTSMPAWKNVLSNKQMRQIVSYIDAAFHPLKRD
ncbi:MAG TPA: c-type cytochrome [Gammaproteobacteria bacterium]|nr:c-type cytochrome [Gammaproteobacteria bacterium]